MDKSGKYCCLLCPSTDYTIRSLSAPCPTCGKAYGFPLQSPPNKIDRYRVIRPLGRGFYAATYLCEYGALNIKYVLKVTSKRVYQYFNKNFDEECRTHQSVSEDTEHIVSIIDYFDSDISFDSDSIPCHVAVIEYVRGVPLDKYLTEEKPSARAYAQIAIDLFRIWMEFTNKLKYHNDLHADNVQIQKLRADARRAEALDDTIRAVAIDLGSVSDASKSDVCDLRFGDQHWLCRHLQRMVEKLRTTHDDIDGVDDLDSRLAEALERVLYFLLPTANAGRIPTAEQLIRIVRDSFSRGASPWREPLRLSQFDDSYNAGALEPWYVPFLLVDPDGLWVKRISVAGPLIITGMRGCGKTMLLRALEFHARAAVEEKEPDPVRRALDRIREDRYVGLFVSCMSLLTIPGHSETPVAIERLFLAYCLQAIRAVRHLRELDRTTVVPNYWDYISETIESNLTLAVVDSASDDDLERFLLRTSAGIAGGEFECSLRTSPAEAFVSLSEAVKRSSPVWSSARVYFLLDDVSTRYLRKDLIPQLFSGLLFHHPTCAFKFTTEAQTLEMVLYSPGLNERARVGRDYDVFDLGAEVNQKTKGRGGRLFIEQVLEQRAKYYPNHPNAIPRTILGDCTLEHIARTIAASGSNSPDRKKAYHGISALSAVCVGDMGDVISIYKQILKREDKRFPVDPRIQSECYQEFCSRRLYDLNRRDSRLKDFALSFAEAAHELLARSIRANEERLRQYSSIYVRITTGDTGWQFDQIRALIDAGVFVLDVGTPRSKTRDGDPIQQFKLSYRKLFGLSNFIGLAERDRFELSGDQLEKWLRQPENGRKILLSNLGGGDDALGDTEDLEDLAKDSETTVDNTGRPPYVQYEWLFGKPRVEFCMCEESDTSSLVKRRLGIEEVSARQLTDSGIELVVMGLGFEERTMESTRRLISYLRPKHAILIRYSEPGKSSEILETVQRKVKDITILNYDRVLSDGLELPQAPTCIDVSGLAKPVLFNAVRDALRKGREVWVCHTRAQVYYPKQEEIAKVIEAEKSQDHYKLLDNLSKILIGEDGPYQMVNLVNSKADESRRKVLCAFASAKHQRLLSLLDARDYDAIEIAIPSAGTPRSDVARIAAEIAASSFGATGTQEIGTDDLIGVTDWLTSQYLKWYVDRGYNLEFGLTGSKLQAVACAVVSTEYKTAQCWYVQPQTFDSNKFTAGTGESTYYRITRLDPRVNTGKETGTPGVG